MTENDRKNLQFLLTASPEQIAIWIKTQDDIAYARELLETAREELIEIALTKRPEYQEANQVLRQFKLS